MRSVHHRVSLTITLVLLLSMMALAMPALADGPLYKPAERVGISFLTRIETPSGFISQSIGEYSLADLKPGWYSDWAYRAAPEMPADMQSGELRPDYAQLIRVSNHQWPPDWGMVQNAVELNTGALWMIGNEPECPNQDAVTPAVYAERYREAYMRIKGWDPTARVANGAIVEVTKLRLEWLDRARAAYMSAYSETMPVDVWNIHIQILSEGSDDDPKAGAGYPVFDPQAPPATWTPREFDLRANASLQVFKTMVYDFRDWMAVVGEQDKELIISEMGVLFPSEYLVPEGFQGDPQLGGDLIVEQFMIDAFDWMYTETDDYVGCSDDEYRLVQRYLWYSLSDFFFWRPDGSASGFNGSLYDYQTKLPARFGRRLIAYQNRFERTHKVVLPFVKNR